MSLPAGAALAAAIVLRYSLWGLVLVSSVAGLGARHARRVAEGVHREVPTWVLMSGVLVLSLSGAIAARFVS